MKRQLLCAVLLLLFCGFLTQTKAQGVVTGISILEYHIPTNVVNGYSETVNDYTASLYYGVYTEGYLYRNLSRIDARAAGPAGRQAIVYTRDPAAAQDTQYDLITDHYIVCVYYRYVGPRLYGRDALGYSLLPFTEVPSPRSYQAPGQEVWIADTVYDLIGSTRIWAGYFPARIDTINPNWGYERGTLDVTLTGWNLDAGSATMWPRINISGGGGSAQVLSVSRTQLNARFTLPDGETGQRQISITTTHNTSNQLPFHVVDRPPVITSVSPSTLDAGTTVNVNINGVDFGAAPDLEVTGGDVQVTINSRSDTNINATFIISEESEGVRSITVISRGRRGTGFLPGPPGTSPRSNPVPVEVKKVKAKIADLVAVPKNGTRSVRVEVTQPNIPVDVTLTIATREGTGQATFADGSTSMVIRQTTDVELKGVTESSTHNNIRLEARSGARSLDHQDFCVLWVTLTIKTNGEVSTANSALNTIREQMGTTDLGLIRSSGLSARRWHNAVEIKGTVHPSNFPQRVYLRRVVTSRYYVDDPTIEQTGLNKNLADDTSPDVLRDDTPESIFDYDAPGLWLGETSSDTIFRQRANFRQYAVWGGENARDSNNVRVSDDLLWFARISIQKNDEGEVVVLYDIEDDNTAGEGETNLTWDLQ